MSKGNLVVLKEMGVPFDQIVGDIRKAAAKHVQADKESAAKAKKAGEPYAATPLTHEQLVGLAEKFASRVNLDGVKAWVIEQIVAEVGAQL